MARILLVDDDEDLTFLLGGYLVHDQHVVDEVNDGTAAWEKLQSETYDIAIFDWDLPGYTGLELLSMYREIGGSAPILMLTGRLEADDKESGLDAGADDYLTKPFEYKELAARIRALLRRSQPKGPKALGTNNEAMLEQAGLTGTVLASRYEFMGIVGEGAVGVVYKARHPHLNKMLAIKMLHYYGLKDDVFARFEQEARLVSSLSHPGIAAVHDFGITERKRPFMVMEYLEGKCLDQVIQEDDYVALAKALPFFIQVCSAMAEAHAKGIVHRDLKPGNIMLCGWPGDGNVQAKVLDFGCGKPSESSAEESRLTKDGSSLGSPAYMSPEQARGHSVDHRSDIYSLGAVIYEAITGYLPLAGDTAMETMLKQIEEQAPRLSEMRPDLSYPETMEHVVAKAMEKDPAKRYQSMNELKSELEQVLSGL
ncbi:MAG: protein kinase [Candidatus Obscuribacterales bacterium]|nr:protein kinase [Candidatus Obscuribacterales bacterium]